jgi:dynein intermediate chain 1
MKILERMTHQNSYHDIAQDFRYWDDASDQFKDGRGNSYPSLFVSLHV